MKTFLLTALLFLVANPANAFLDQLKKQLETIKVPQQLGVTQPHSGQTNVAGTSTSEGTIDRVCKSVLPSPYEGKLPEGQSPEAIVGRYFRVSANLSEELRSKIDVMHGVVAMPNLRDVIKLGDLRDNKVESLAQAFVSDPSVTNLAHIVYLAETGDGYEPEDGPSEKTEARTLLALTMLQYPDLALDRNLAPKILRENFLKKSGLSVALLARFHLFGDYLSKDVNAFSNYAGQASSLYQVHLNDQSIFYALEKIPNWQFKKQYEDLINQSKQMQDSLNRSKGSTQASASLRQRSQELVEKGLELDYQTMEALGAGPLVAQLRASGERKKKEASGEANIIGIAVSTSDEYRKEFEKLLASSPKLSEEAKNQLKAANQKRAENVNEMYALTGQIAMLFFNGNFGETQELGGQLNAYFRNACDVTFRSIRYAKESGVPEPIVSIDREAELFGQ